MKIHAIGFAGFAGVGKSTFAEGLSKELRSAYDLRAMILPIAAELKRKVFLALDREEGSIYNMAVQLGVKEDENPFDKPYSPAMRKLLQEVGTEARNRDAFIWVKEWLFNAACNAHRYDLFLVDDIRFFEEKYFIKGLGGVYFLRRKGVRSDGHESESLYPDKNDYVINLADMNSRHDEWEQQVKSVARDVVRQLLRG